MNELHVEVQQTPGSVTWNYEELKTSVTKALKIYKTTVYDDTNIGTAKKDRAMLNKLSKSVDDRKKEIKKKCLEPYALIETQAKELMAIIQEPIAVIDEQLEAYEKARRQRAKAAIMEYMNKAFEEIDPDIAERAKKDLYDTKWENASAKKSEWKAAIDNGVQAVRSDLQIIEGIEEEFRPFARDAYMLNLRLSDAMAKSQEMRAQKEAILKKQQEEMESLKQEKPQSSIGKTISGITGNAFTQTVAAEEVSGPAPAQTVATLKETETGAVPGRMIRIIGTDDQYKKVLTYIRFIGADYEEV